MDPKAASLRRSLLLIVAVGLGACAAAGDAGTGGGEGKAGREHELARVGATLDALHAAASDADGARYFALFDPEAVFLGTDASERWTLDEFRAFAMPYFDRGEGWTYRPIERHVYLSAAGDVAWFDERLSNDAYGETRGTGVLVRSGAEPDPWRIAQYDLTIPVPNALAKDLVERIRALAGEH